MLKNWKRSRPADVKKKMRLRSKSEQEFLLSPKKVYEVKELYSDDDSVPENNNSGNNKKSSEEESFNTGGEEEYNSLQV